MGHTRVVPEQQGNGGSTDTWTSTVVVLALFLYASLHTINKFELRPVVFTVKVYRPHMIQGPGPVLIRVRVEGLSLVGAYDCISKLATVRLRVRAIVLMMSTIGST